MPICAGENMRQLATAGVERERAQQYRADVPQPRAGRLQPLADTAPRGRRRRRGVWRGPPRPGRRAGGAVALVLAIGVTQPSGAPRHFLTSGPLPSDLK